MPLLAYDIGIIIIIIIIKASTKILSGFSTCLRICLRFVVLMNTLQNGTVMQEMLLRNTLQ